MLNFSFKNRSSHLQELKTKEFDVLVIGGGVTGAGVARDAAMRGLKVALVEQADFSSGTSSRSSKLAHGGLRYLENLEFGLVSEALHERQNLLRIAPHMVRPLDFLMPIYKGDRVGRLKMKMGMVLYDMLSAWKSPKLHKSISAKKIAENYQYIKTEGLTGGFVYSDALMDDDRLVLETLRSAVDFGATVISHVKATAYEFKTDEPTYVSCEDLKTNETFKIKANHVISCAGPWTDQVGGKINSSWKNKMRPSKGAHITLPKSKLNLKTAVVMAAAKNNRILFCIPREGFDIIGTTDTDYKGSLSKVYANRKDIDYILNILNEYFPEAKVNDDDILSSYAGVRPLVKDGSVSESKVSRSHWIKNDEQKKVTYISGGKYTTYLSMAEECVDSVLKTNSNLKIKAKENIKTRIDLVEANTVNVDELFLKRWNEETHHWTDKDRDDFFLRHGSQSLKFIDEFKKPAIGFLELEALVAINKYCCGSLEDFYFRRTPYVLRDQALDDKSIMLVLSAFSNELGWSNEECELQKKKLQAAVQKELAWR